MIQFLLDAGVPRSIQRFLESQGYRVSHVADLDLMAANDEQIYEYASNGNYTLISRDKDFGNLLEYALKDAGIIIIRDLNLGAQELVDLFKAAWHEIDPSDVVGALIIIDRNKLRLRKY